MAENALIVSSQRAAKSCKKAGVAILISAIALATWCATARAESTVPDIKLRPSTKAKQDETKKATNFRAKPAKKKEGAVKTSGDVIPEIALQRITPRPITVASNVKAKSPSKAPAKGATANAPSRASDSQTLAAQTSEVSPAGKSTTQEAARPSLKRTTGQASIGTRPTSTIEQATSIIDDSQRPEIHLASPIDATDYTRFRAQSAPLQANYQVEQLPVPEGAENQAPAGQPQDPCAAITGRPFYDFGISTTIPEGDLPVDVASGCWNNVNAAAGPFPGYRSWASSMYAWDATSLCYRPLYFEEANLERYGYGCCETMQPLASAAHFFGTIPLLPYCMATDCPNECIYTLGHYRPGSHVPKRYIWPPVSPRAILAEGGVWTGLVFLIP
jgi:hypothetical protein